MRLHFLDMLRGFAVLWMIVFQLLDMFAYDVDLYSGFFYWGIGRNYVSWFCFFMVVAGFGFSLMSEKYEAKKFFRRVIRRFFDFLLIGGFLIVWCRFELNKLGIFDEVLASIGLNLMILSIPIYLTKFINRKFRIVSSFMLMLLFVWLNHTLRLEGMFNVFFVSSFMIFGVLLAQLRDHKVSWLLLGFLCIALSFIGETPNFVLRNTQFILSSSGIISLILLLMVFLEKSKRAKNFFNHFGLNALFYYVLHFAIFRFGLLNLGLYKTFNLSDSIILTVLSIIVLVIIEKKIRPLM